MKPIIFALMSFALCIAWVEAHELDIAATLVPTCVCTEIIIECPYGWEPDPVVASAACLAYTQSCARTWASYQNCKFKGQTPWECYESYQFNKAVDEATYKNAVESSCVPQD